MVLKHCKSEFAFQSKLFNEGLKNCFLAALHLFHLLVITFWGIISPHQVQSRRGCNQRDWPFPPSSWAQYLSWTNWTFYLGILYLELNNASLKQKSNQSAFVSALDAQPNSCIVDLIEITGTPGSAHSDSDFSLRFFCPSLQSCTPSKFL